MCVKNIATDCLTPFFFLSIIATDCFIFALTRIYFSCCTKIFFGVRLFFSLHGSCFTLFCFTVLYHLLYFRHNGQCFLSVSKNKPLYALFFLLTPKYFTLYHFIITLYCFCFTTDCFIYLLHLLPK